MTFCVARPLLPEEAHLANGLDTRIKEFWIVTHGETVICVTTKDSANGLKWFLNNNEEMREFFKGRDLLFVALKKHKTNGKIFRVANCVSLECQKYIEDNWGSRDDTLEKTHTVVGLGDS